MITTQKRAGRAVQSAAVFIGAFVLLLFFSCEQSGRDPTEQGGGVGRSALSPSPGFTEADLLLTFGLTRGGITASAAAEKIRAAAGSGTGEVTFTKKEIISYDDEEGVFAVHVKGAKNGKEFDEKFEVSGFTHPYRGTEVQSVYFQDKKLVFKQAIEENLPLSTFVERANAEHGNGYLSFKLRLSDGRDIEFGKHNGYSVTACLKEEGGEKIRIQSASYNILSKTLKDGKHDEKILSSYPLQSISSTVENYFTEQDVFNYILEKVKNDSSFIKADAKKFASEIYANTMVTNTGVNIFDDTKLEPYKKLYGTDSQDRHLKIEDITAAVDNIRNGGIDADDYNGTLTVTYYIAKKALVTDIADAKTVSKTSTVTQKGFLQLDKNHIQKWISFSLGKDGGTLEKWKNSDIALSHLIRKNDGSVDVNYSNWFILNKDVLKKGHHSGYYLIFNSGTFADGDEAPDPSNKFLATTHSGEYILIPQITVQKKAKGAEELTISVSFMGNSEPVKLEVKPNH